MTGKRAIERVRVDAFVKVQGDEINELVFRTRDISEQGLFLYTQVAQAYPFKVGSALEVELEQILFKVVVVRVVEPGSVEAETFPAGFGVRIVEITDEARAQIRALVERVTNG